ncbi:hypothetical protein [Bosea lathyri]|uniref:hypothetical protein n=1 Tax=Bosea lathyri TaxID=1036778 RepID=UPI000CDE598A|nr:hypothetical protein [Bosea lathyri]
MLFDMEDDARGAVEMAQAIFELVEQEIVRGNKGLSPLLRCVAHMQDHSKSVLRIWELAHQQETGRP